MPFNKSTLSTAEFSISILKKSMDKACPKTTDNYNYNNILLKILCTKFENQKCDINKNENNKVYRVYIKRTHFEMWLTWVCFSLHQSFSIQA